MDLDAQWQETYAGAFSNIVRLYKNDYKFQAVITKFNMLDQYNILNTYTNNAYLSTKSGTLTDFNSAEKKEAGEFLNNLIKKLNQKFNYHNTGFGSWGKNTTDLKTALYGKYINIVGIIIDLFNNVGNKQTGGRRNTRGLRRKNRKTKRSRLP